MKNIIDGGFDGLVLPVNPKGGTILNNKVCVDIDQIEGEIDLAIIVIPAIFVLDSVLKLAKKGAKALIIISAGFGETGHDGKDLQDQIAKICQDNNIALLGPNCLGLINTNLKLNATFAQEMPRGGGISFLSQSGAIITSMISWSKTASTGFSKIFSLGNKALLDEADLLEYLYLDDETKVIVGYLEQLEVTDRLTEVLQKYATTKPTVFLFGGKSTYGAKAALSHTGSIVTSYLSVKTYLYDAGVIIAADMEDLLLKAHVLAAYQKMAGNSIAIVTNAGGPGIATSDAIAAAHLKMAKFSDKTIDRLAQKLKSEACLTNPVDVLGDATELDYKFALETIKDDPAVDAIIVILTPQSSTKITETAEIIAKLKTSKPVFAAFIGGYDLRVPREIIEKSGKPCFVYPEDAVMAAKSIYLFNTIRPRISICRACATAIYDPAKKDKTFDRFGLPIVKYFVSDKLKEILARAEKIGYPVVLKTASPDINHKTESGGVKLNLQNAAEVTRAFDDIPKPVSIGKMIKGKHEIFLGAKKDSNVGTIIAFGTGGIYAEIYKDLSYRIAPVSHRSAKEMIMETKMGEILAGARGLKPYDLDKMAEIITSVSSFVTEHGNISEADFNPLVADGTDFHIVDSRIILDEKAVNIKQFVNIV